MGASHPFKISNTYALYRNGWRGVTLEPIQRLFNAHRRYRPRDIQLNAGVSNRSGTLRFHELVPSVLSTFDASAAQRAVLHAGAVLHKVIDIPLIGLAEVQAQYFGEKRVDLLSIDIEGGELDALRSWDWPHLPPRLILCETTQVDGRSCSDTLSAFLASEATASCAYSAATRSTSTATDVRSLLPYGTDHDACIRRSGILLPVNRATTRRLRHSAGDRLFVRHENSVTEVEFLPRTDRSRSNRPPWMTPGRSRRRYAR